MSKRKGYGQFCPVAKASEIVAERWTPLILRELMSGARRFNDLRRGNPLVSPSLLSSRLKNLEDAGVIERHLAEDGRSWEYIPTEAGRELFPIIEQLGVWGQRWARSRLQSTDLDASLLMWDIRRRIDPEPLESRTRTVIQFELTGAKRGMKRWWLLIEDGDVDLCLQHPGFEVDLSIRSDLPTLTRVWMGDLEPRAALRDGSLVLEGNRRLTRSFSKWFTLNHFAHVERPRL